MKRALRSVIAVLAGLLAGSVIIFLVEMISATIYDLPTAEVVAASNLEYLPTGAFVFLLIGWFLGCALASFTTAMLSGPSRAVHAAVVTVLFLGAGIFNLLTLPHPLWMWPATILAFALGGVAGAKLGGAGRDAFLGTLSMGPG
jgi:hypothetical protein